MLDQIDPRLLSLIITVGGSVVWFLLKKQNTDQEKSIDMLFKKHDEDAERLRQLERAIDRDHYQKGELDAKFDRIEAAIEKSIGLLGVKFDAMAVQLHSLTTTIVAHVEKEDKQNRG